MACAGGGRGDSFASVFESWRVEMSPATQRVVEPARPVLVNLNAILGSPDDAFRLDTVELRIKSEGLDVFRDRVPGLLHAWAQTTRGGWLALISCDVKSGNGKGHLPIEQWCPARAVTPDRGR